MEEHKLAIFEGKKIRKTIHNNEWWFSIIDVIEVLTGSSIPKRYWSDLKRKLVNEGYSELYERIVQLKFAAADAKFYNTDCANTETMFRVVQSIPSPRVEPLKRWLAKVGKERMELSSRDKTPVRSRMRASPSGILYVFLACKRGTERKNRIAELQVRCFVARGLNPESKTVIGLATERYEEEKGFSLDAFCLEKQIWTEEDQKKLEYLKNELGFFKAPVQSTGSEDEYPVA